MKRKLYYKLCAWKARKQCPPLILKGARQVGKSYLLKQFGAHEFDNFYHFDFEKNHTELAPFFAKDLNVHKILENLSFYVGKSIIPGKDLIIFDEIQNCPRALSSLKYFNEDMPTLHICAAGSLLGIYLANESYPVGKVTHFELFPMSFEEFLWQSDSALLVEAFNAAIKKREMPEAAHNKCWEVLKEYYVIGGMPAAVNLWLGQKADKVNAMNSVREMQYELIENYKADFKKHAGNLNAMHIITVFENIPKQLSRVLNGSLKRFYFKDVIPGKRRFIELEGPINWLEKAGLIYKVWPVSRIENPLTAFTKANIFKLFCFDIGILGAMLNLSPGTIILQDYGITKGYFAENYAATQLKACGIKELYSWQNRSYEIDYLLERDSRIIPVEIKAGTKKAIKSLKYLLSFSRTGQGLLLSADNLDFSGKDIINIPLYLAGKLDEL